MAPEVMNTTITSDVLCHISHQIENAESVEISTNSASPPRGEGGIKRALRALLPGSAKRRQEDGHAQHAFKARLSLTKALLKVKPVDDSTGFRERRRRDLK